MRLRLSLLTTSVALAASLGLAPCVQAQAPAWSPQKPIRLLISAPPGTAPDIIGRLMGDKLDPLLGQRVLIDNRPAAQGVVAVENLRSSPADGHTLALLQAAAAVVTPFTYKGANYDIERDLETIATIANTPMLFVGTPKAPARTLPELIAVARSRPGEIAIGNPIRSSIPHLAAELLGQRTGVKFQHVSFTSTAQGIQALSAGDLPYYVDGTAPLMPLIKSGRLIAVAVAAERVLPGLEGIALAHDTVRDLNVYGWFVVVAPKGTPTAALQRINTEINKVLAMPEIVTRFADLGTYTMPGSLEDAQRFVRNEKALFSGAIREAGISAE
jgi:tripartite-type tricarboxylate transporter receptor subunit TctC